MSEIKLESVAIELSGHSIDDIISDAKLKTYPKGKVLSATLILLCENESE